MGDPRRKPQDGLVLAPAPHLRAPTTTAGMSWLVAASLLPAAAWGILLFGVPALRVLGAALAAALAAEALTTLPFGRFTLRDGNAALTGLLVGMFMPAGISVVVPVAASFFGIVVVKQTFGGLGRNWMNPAAGGILFAFLSWGGSMGAWTALPASGAVTTPLAALRAALDGGATGGPLAVLNAAGYPFSRFDAAVVGWLNGHLLSLFHVSLPSGWFDVFAGIVVGPIGAVSAPLLAAAAIILAARRIIRWEVPVAALAVFVVLTVAVGGLSAGPVFHVFSGTMLLGSFFVATDPVTSPLSRNGRWLHGALLGVLVWLLRFSGTLGDGVIVAIALGSAIVPLIDSGTLRHRSQPRREESS